MFYMCICVTCVCVCVCVCVCASPINAALQCLRDINCVLPNNLRGLIPALTFFCTDEYGRQYTQYTRRCCCPYSIEYIVHVRWLGSRVVNVVDSGAEAPGFKSQPRRCRVTVLGKLLCLCSPSSKIRPGHYANLNHHNPSLHLCGVLRVPGARGLSGASERRPGLFRRLPDDDPAGVLLHVPHEHQPAHSAPRPSNHAERARAAALAQPTLVSSCVLVTTTCNKIKASSSGGSRGCPGCPDTRPFV